MRIESKFRAGARALAVGVAALVVALACGGTSGGGGGSSPVTFKGTKKVGLSTSLSGSIASYGQAGLNGVQMAIDDINAKGGVNGYKIELDQADDQVKADVGSDNAKRMMLEDKVVAMFGAVSSAICLAESPLAKQYKVPFFTFTCNDFNLTTTKFQPYIVSVVPNTYMEGQSIGAELGKKSGLKTVHILAPDYSFGHTEADSFKQKLSALNPGVQYIEDYPKQGTTDFTPYITKILAEKPDVVYSNIYSGDLVTFVKQAKSYDFFNKVTFTTLVATDDLQTLGADYPTNLLGYARAPFYAIDTPQNKDFVKRYSAKYSKAPSEWAILGYDAVNVWAGAANSAGTFDADKVVAKAAGQSFTTLRGKINIRALDHQADVPEWIGTTATTPDYPFPIFKSATPVTGLLMTEDQVRKLQPSS